VATELKSWPIIGAFQKHVDVYFHLLSVPKGKGGFYLFIGLLTFCASDWGMASVCVMIVTIVGVLHLAGIPADSRTTSSMAGTDGAQHHQDSMEPLDAAASASISNFALKVWPRSGRVPSSHAPAAHTHAAARTPLRRAVSHAISTCPYARRGAPGDARQP